VSATLTPVTACWVCGGAHLTRVHDARLEFTEYRTQDPELADYSGRRLPIVRCTACGFAQPASLPALPRYFDRMYDQRWSADWVEREHHAAYKDRIFDDVLAALEARLPRRGAGCSTSARTPDDSSPARAPADGTPTASS
jgi:hypothetical protein